MTTTEQPCAVGDAAPDLPITAPDHTTMQLSTLWAERPLALVFFRSLHSEFCVDNAVQLRDADEKMREAGGDIVVVCAARPAAAGSFAERWSLPYRLYAVDGAAYARYAVTPDEPGSFVVGRDGVVHFAHRGHGPTDNPSTWSLIDVVCALTGRRVEQPDLSKPPSALNGDAAPDAPAVPTPGDASKLNFTCAKCGHRECEVLDTSMSSGMLSRLFNFQHRRFSAVVCRHCEYTEFYRTESGNLRNIFDLLAGS